MLDHTAAVLAMRNRALGLVVCTTGAVSLSATVNGYNRLAGSFVADGFAVGMEVTPSGFTTATNNNPGIVTAVSATDLTIRGGRTAEAAGSRTIQVGLPALRAWENIDFEPQSGRPYVEEDFVPAGSTLDSGPAAGGIVEETGLYILRWYGLSNTGLSGILKCVDALKARFTSGTNLVAGSDTVRVRGDIGPWAGQALPQGNGWTVCTLTVPWRAYFNNAIAA